MLDLLNEFDYLGKVAVIALETQVRHQHCYRIHLVTYPVYLCWRKFLLVAKET